MHIAIDASRTTLARRTGTERYALSLLRALLASETQHTFTLYFRDEPPPDLLPGGSHITHRVIPFPKLWTHLRLATALWADRPDITFVPAHALPLVFPGKAVVTVHDLGYHFFPEAHAGWPRRYYGWKDPFVMARFGRNDFRQRSALPKYRAYPEGWVTARGIGKGSDGIGRMGADFWYVLKDKRGRLKGTLAGHYSPWGGLDLNSYGVTYVLGPGKKRPVTTVRYELLRENVQENEARFFLEKVLTEETRRAKLGEDLAARAQEILDRRVRAYLAFDIGYIASNDARWFTCSDWQARSRELYAAAAEVAKKLGDE